MLSLIQPNLAEFARVTSYEKFDYAKLSLRTSNLP